MNSSSSRSHSILTLTVETKQIINEKIVKQYPKINFVDLAGSETLKKTGAKNQRKSEAIYINKSLDTLKKVINALEERK